jgi:hypothetical protein
MTISAPVISRAQKATTVIQCVTRTNNEWRGACGFAAGPAADTRGEYHALRTGNEVTAAQNVMNRSGSQNRHDRRWVPEGANHYDLSGIDTIDHINALEFDGLSIASDALAGPLHGCRITTREDRILCQVNQFESTKNLGKECSDSVMSKIRRSSNGILLFSIRREYGDTALDIHSSNRGKVLRYDCFYRCGHRQMILAFEGTE